MYLHLVKKGIIFLVCMTLLACTEISYKEPQPKRIKSLESVPAKLHGTYLWENDTVIFFDKGFRVQDKKEDVLYLSDSIVLKKYKNHYFVNYREGFEWRLRILKPLKNGNLMFLEMENVPEDAAERKIYIEKLSVVTPVIETSVDNSTHYIIDPSARKLYALIRKGYFKERKPLQKIK